jgi:Arc/MetJ-type ribon-helix-helix transcriptional regulator
MTKLEHVTLSDEAARFAAAQVSAGRFQSVDDVLAAGVEALQERDQIQHDWLVYARRCFDQGRTAFSRGEILETTPDELMDSIEQELGIAQ